MSNCAACKVFHLNNVSLCDACLDKATVRVGTVTVHEAAEMDDSFESASQWRSVRVEPGDYPIEVRVSRFDARRYVVVVYQGVVTSSGYGNKRYTDEIGTRGELIRQPYKYQLRSGSYWGGAVTITDDATLETAFGV